MKPSAPADSQPQNSPQAILDPEEREAVVQPIISSLNAEATECFADFLITLINETHRQASGAPRLEGELLAALELTFRSSKAYELAHDLYGSRFHFVPGRVSIIGLTLADMLAEIKRSRVTERQQAAPAEWAMEFGGAVGRLLKDEGLSEVTYASLCDPLTELVSDTEHQVGSLGLALLPFVLTKFFAKMPAPKIIVLITAADARSPKEPIEMGRLTRGEVWEDFEKLVTDLDELLPATDVEQYHPLTIALEREDGARFVVYRRGVGDGQVKKLFDYAEIHLEVESSIRSTPRPQTGDAPTDEADAPPEQTAAGPQQPSEDDSTAQCLLSRPVAPAGWIERFSEMIAEAIESELLPQEARNDLADMVIKITGDHASRCSDHARNLLPVALYRFNGEPEPVTGAAPSSWIDRLGPVIAEALESGQLPTDTHKELEDFVVRITDQHASGYADQARLLLGLGLRRLMTESPDEADEDDDDEDAGDDDSQDDDEQPDQIFNLCDYEDLKLDFLLSEGGDKAFSFSLHRDPSTKERGKGFADVCFYTFGEKDASYMYEANYLPKREGAIEHKVSLVISSEGKVNFCGPKDELLFSLYWERDDDDLDGGFDVYDAAGLSQSLEFFR
jgi:hypothetical protein